MKLYLLMALASVQVMAVVDMKNANYSETSIDLEVPGSGYPLRIERTNNSRSLHNGIFGFGMCSDFETTLDVTSEGSLKITECGAGLEVLYLPKSSTPKDIEKSASQIIKAYKTQNPTISSAALKNLREQLIKDQSFRDLQAESLGIRGTLNEELFYANGRGPEIIEVKGKTYSRKVPGGEIERFDEKGRLVQRTDRNGNWLKFNYTNDTLKDVQDNNGRRLSFTYFDNKKVKKITSSSNLTAEYKYKNLVDLSEVKNAWGNTYKYEYDELHNVTLIQYPDGTNKKLTYDQNKDWVLSFKDREDCLETYKYESSKDDPLNHFWSTATKKCKDKVVTTARFEFWYKTDKLKGDHYLQRVVVKNKDQNSDITYHPTLGRPILVKKNGQSVAYEYDENSGLLRSRKEGKRTVKFAYDSSCQKVSRVNEGKVWSEFKYDENCNLTSAKNSRGQNVGLEYDRLGRIVQLNDQAKRQVKISYEEKFGKPKIVERTGLGKLQVTYKSNGEVDQVDSPDGPGVATQVAGSFNNLLEVVEPAGVDIGF